MRIRIRSFAAKISAQKEFASFTLVRLIGVAMRPAVLFMLIQSGQSTAANEFALLLSCVASSFILLNNQNYRSVYQLFLKPTNTVSRKASINGRDAILAYLDGVFFHSIFALPILLLVVCLWTAEPLIIGATILICLTERYFDDDQRYELFRHRYLGWSLNFTFRVIIPSILVLVGGLLASPHIIAIYTIASLGCALAYIVLFRSRFVRLLGHWVHSHKQALRHGLPIRIGIYLNKFREEYAGSQLWSFISANLLIIDRFMVNMAFPNRIAEYVLIVNAASIITLVHNLIFFTKVRPKLIDSQLNETRLMFSAANWGVPIGLAAIMTAAFWLIDALGLYAGESDLLLVGLLCGVYAIDAVSLVIADLAFWRVKRGALILVSILGFGIFGAAYFVLPPVLWSIPLSMLFAITLRNGLFLHLSRSNYANLRDTL